MKYLKIFAFMFIASMTMVSCGGDDDESSNGKEVGKAENSEDCAFRAITGNVEELTYTKAKINMTFEFVEDLGDGYNISFGLKISDNIDNLSKTYLFSWRQDINFKKEEGTYTLSVNHLKPNTKYYYRAVADCGKDNYSLGAIKSFTTPKFYVDDAGYEYVDLGLPSGTCWATHNIGAKKPEEVGDKFYWAGTAKYEDPQDLTRPSGQFYDAAFYLWGGTWRVPSIDDVYELYDNCTKKQDTVGRVNGMRVTGPNGNSIFFPYSESTSSETYARFWTSNYEAGASGSAHFFGISTKFGFMRAVVQSTGYKSCIRPVISTTGPEKTNY